LKNNGQKTDFLKKETVFLFFWMIPAGILKNMSKSKYNECGKMWVIA